MFAAASIQAGSSSALSTAKTSSARAPSSSLVVVARAASVSSSAPSTSGRVGRAQQQQQYQLAPAFAAPSSSAASVLRGGAVVVARAADPSGAPAGQISAALMESMRAKIGAALETDQVTVQDVNGDGRHVEIDVTSALFEGKTAVQRQRLVYKAIWEELQEAVHAVDAMTTRAPGE